MTTISDQLKIAAEWIRDADGILVTAGAGMGVDSGLSDFRDEDGFWRAHPAVNADGIGFEDIASNEAFHHDPVRAWGFYGHWLNLYRRTVPHEGFDILRRWVSTKEHGAFVFTSNIDGQFQKAGFEERRIIECHGSLHRLQCLRPCAYETWSADDLHPDVDEEHCRLLSALPRCPRCDNVARPNILMLNDDDWNDYAVRRRRMRLEAWLLRVDQVVVVELGADRTVPVVRNMSEQSGHRIIRVNMNEWEIDSPRGISRCGRSLELLRALDEAAGQP